MELALQGWHPSRRRRVILQILQRELMAAAPRGLGELLLSLSLVVLAVLLMIAGFVFVRRDRAVPAYALSSAVMAIYAVVAVRGGFEVFHIITAIVMSLGLAGLAVGTYLEDRR